jgi:N-acyl-D-aspartate/D-glutamate deacylase
MSYDIVIRGGTIVDGTGAPRFRSDVAIKDGRIAAVGTIDPTGAVKVIDADGLIVAPGFIDLHTHYDAQVFWDPYCTISGWHGVTTVVIGNCGNGFAPVAPELRDRMMRSLSRIEAIPLASMQASLPWDWVTFPEFVDSLKRTPKAVNVMAYLPAGEALVWVLGLEDAKAGRAATPEEMEQLKELMREAMDAGAAGWSAQRMPPSGGISNHRDYDGGPMPTDQMSDDIAFALGEVLGERNQGFIQLAFATGDPKKDALHIEELARRSNRPILYNILQTNDAFPHRHRNTIKFLERCRKAGLKVYGQAHTTAAGLTWTFEDWNLFDDADAWMEATTGSYEEKLAKLGDAERRPALREQVPKALIPNMDDIVVLKCEDPALQHYHDLKLGEIAAREGKAAIDVMLDISVADGLRTTFYADSFTNALDLLAEVVRYPWSIYGTSDGGAHTKFITSGRYPTETLTKFVRDHEIIELEEAHYRLSGFPAYLAGLPDRGRLFPGAVADLIVYDLDALALGDVEIAADVPGDEWRRVQGATGYRYTIVGGEVTLVDGSPTGAMSGSFVSPAAEVAV